MERPDPNRFRADLPARLTWLIAVSTFVLLRSAIPPRGLDEQGLAAVRDLAFTTATWGLVTLLAIGLGRKVLRWLGPGDISRLEFVVFAFGLGTALISAVMFGMGLTFSFSRTAVAVLLLGLSWWLAPWLTRSVRLVRPLTAELGSHWRNTDRFTRAATAMLAGIAAMSFLSSLSPPWDYDGLMYHLLGPRLFLDAGGLFPYPDNWYINGPFAVEMIFSIGMAFGDDVFPRLVHYAFGVEFVLVMSAMARRWFAPRVSVLATLILLGVPTLPVWASFSYIDLGWSAYELLAVAALLTWWKTRDKAWLVLVGANLGAAAAAKYLGLVGAAILVIAALIPFFSQGFRATLRQVLPLVIPALLLAGPWYLRNVVWFGNPVFPLIFGGPGWDHQRLQDYMAYLSSFGTGRRLADLLLLPVNVYLQHERFGTVMNSIDIPSLLFPFALLSPFVGSNRVVRTLLGLAAIRLALWTVGSQQLRFLLPVYPLLAICAGYAISQVSQRMTRPAWRFVMPALAIGLTGITGFYQAVILIQFRPLAPTLGLQTSEAFLQSRNRDYPAIRHFLRRSAAEDRLLMIGDARGYACPYQCIPDPDHFRWARQIVELERVEDLEHWLKELRATHVLWSIEDLDFLLQHDPQGLLRQALHRLLEFEQSGCLNPEFSDAWATVYRIECR